MNERARTAGLGHFTGGQFAFDLQISLRDQHVFAEGTAGPGLAIGAVAGIGRQSEPVLQAVPHSAAIAPAGQFAFHRSASPFSFMRHRTISIRSCPKNGSPSNTSVGTPQWPEASRAS